MSNSKPRDLNQMKSPQQQQNTDVSKSPGSSDTKASNQQADIPSGQQTTQGGQQDSRNAKQANSDVNSGKNSNTQHK
jgi:hypothetical protein